MSGLSNWVNGGSACCEQWNSKKIDVAYGALGIHLWHRGIKKCQILTQKSRDPVSLVLWWQCTNSNPGIQSFIALYYIFLYTEEWGRAKELIPIGVSIGKQSRVVLSRKRKLQAILSILINFSKMSTFPKHSWTRGRFCHSSGSDGGQPCHSHGPGALASFILLCPCQP